jgi:hypothetical protein
LSVLNETFHSTLDARNQATGKRLDELNQRITDLDTKFETEKAEILRVIEERGRELARMLNEFKVKRSLSRTGTTLNMLTPECCHIYLISS